MEQRLGDRVDQRNKLIEEDMKVRRKREERLEKRNKLKKSPSLIGKDWSFYG